MNTGKRKPDAGENRRNRRAPQAGRSWLSGIRPARRSLGDGGYRISGFTLLEVLVALAIFAMAAVVLGATYVNALNAYEAASRRNEYDEDLRFARAVVLTLADRDKVEEGGDLNLGGEKRARWQAEITSTGTADLFAVRWTCVITDPARPTPFRTTQNFLVLRPTWSDPVERSQLMDEAKKRILELQGTAP